MSPITSNIVTILALSSTALALPRFHRHQVDGAWGGAGSWSWGGQGSDSSPSAVVTTTQAESPAAEATTTTTSVTTAAVATSAAETTTTASVTVHTSTSSTASSTASTSTASSSSSSSSSSSKLGLSYNTASLLSAFDGSDAAWAYNWAATPDGTLSSDLEFVPMLWGLKTLDVWADGVASSIASGSKHVLSFNEPDLSAQSNLEPAAAAENHIKYLNPLAGQVEIGSPAVTNGAGTSPLLGLDWLNSFFDSCDGKCQVDFVAFHWYDAATNIDGFKSHVQDVIDAAANNGVSKVWLTEFGTTSGTDDEKASFISEATDFLDSTAAVERYAYFMVGDGSGQLLSSSGTLNTLGEAYVS
ncbi:hypothetical protein DV735_g1136, partial [Chaetothyriales sp. CBS 134920]